MQHSPETISNFVHDGDSIYSCFYDLTSVFDTVEYPVLLSHLKKAGVSEMAWHLIKDWYTNVRSSVRVGRQVSPSFSVSRRVHQGSILSPTLFLLVMDSILLELTKRSCCPSACGLSILGPAPMRSIFEHCPPTFPTASYRWRSRPGSECR